MSNKPHRPFAASQGLVLTSTCADTTYTNVPSGGESLLSRKSSGIYDNFACVRVGDYDLPSSMDLRQYLDEMQEVGHWEEDADLPTIPDDEVGCHPCPTPPPPTPAPRPPFLSCFHSLLVPAYVLEMVIQHSVFALHTSQTYNVSTTGLPLLPRSSL